MANSNLTGQHKAAQAGYEIAYQMTQPNGSKGLYIPEQKPKTRLQAKKQAARQALRGLNAVVQRVH